MLKHKRLKQVKKVRDDFITIFTVTAQDEVLPEFKKLNLSVLVRQALHESNPNITAPTPIQKQAIPTILKWRSDVVIASHTGSGKTYSFLLPLIQMMK